MGNGRWCHIRCTGSRLGPLYYHAQAGGRANQPLCCGRYSERHIPRFHRLLDNPDAGRQRGGRRNDDRHASDARSRTAKIHEHSQDGQLHEYGPPTKHPDFIQAGPHSVHGRRERLGNRSVDGPNDFGRHVGIRTSVFRRYVGLQCFFGEHSDDRPNFPKVGRRHDHQARRREQRRMGNRNILLLR